MSSQQMTSKELIVARVTARILAGFLDNAIWISGFLLVNSSAISSSLKIIFAVLFPLIYFTVGNSEVMNGQTLGKKLFRIRVQTLDGKFLSLSRSFVRYFIVWGIFFSETTLVPILYRKYEIVASGVWDLPPLIVNLVIYSVYVPILFTYSRRGLHDFITQTIVTQASSKNPGILLQDAKAHDTRTLPLSWCLAVLLSFFSPLRNAPECEPEITLSQQRYAIENKFNVRMGYYSVYGPFLSFFTEESKDEESFKNKTKGILDYLNQTSEVFRPSLPEKFKVIYYFPPKNPEQFHDENPLGFEVNRDTFEMISIPPEELTLEKLYPEASPSNNS